MKKLSVVFYISFLILLSCATIQNNRDKEQKRAVYREIQNEMDKLDPSECRNFLVNYLAGKANVTARYRDNRGVNWGHLAIHSPIKATANLFINTYRYRRDLNDPREIYYLLKHMQSFSQFEVTYKNTIERLSPATFYPQNSEEVTVRMINGAHTAFIDNEKYRITVNFDGNFEEKGKTTDFIVGITNYSTEYYIISRYTDFQLEYTKNGNTYVYNNALNFDEWVDRNPSVRYARSRMYQNEQLNQSYQKTYQLFYKENDISPRSDPHAGIISFPSNNFDSFDLIIFDSFDLIINVRLENLILRKPGEYTTETYVIHFEK